MIEIILFIAISASLGYSLRVWSKKRSKRCLYIFKHIVLFVVGVQYYSIFSYSMPVKGGVDGRILFFEDFLVESLDLPNSVQFFALAFVIYLAFFCHPKREQ